MKETIGERIKQVRERNNLSTISFAKTLGISQPSLTALENNKSEPRAKTITALIDTYGIDPYWLLKGKTKHVIQSPTALKLGTLVDKLPEAVQFLFVMLAERETLLESLLEEKKKYSVADMAAEAPRENFE